MIIRHSVIVIIVYQYYFLFFTNPTGSTKLNTLGYMTSNRRGEPDGMDTELYKNSLQKSDNVSMEVTHLPAQRTKSNPVPMGKN
jgi:hypothetical protein